MKELKIRNTVSEHIGQHGRHVWRDHAGAFGEPGDVDGLSIDLDRSPGPLGERICRPNGASGCFNAVRRQAAFRGLQSPDDLIMGELFADHASRGRENACLGQIEKVRDRIGQGRDRAFAVHASKRVGIPGIHKNGRSRPV